MQQHKILIFALFICTTIIPMENPSENSALKTVYFMESGAWIPFEISNQKLKDFKVFNNLVNDMTDDKNDENNTIYAPKNISFLKFKNLLELFPIEQANDAFKNNKDPKDLIPFLEIADQLGLKKSKFKDLCNIFESKTINAPKENLQKNIEALSKSAINLTLGAKSTLHKTLYNSLSKTILEYSYKIKMTSKINDTAIDPGGKLLAIQLPRQVQIYDSATKKLLHTITNDYLTINTLALDPDGKLLAIGFDKKITIYDIATKKLLHNLSHTDNIMGIEFHPHKKEIVSNAVNCSLKIWDTNTGKEIPDLPYANHADDTRRVTFHPNKKLLASVSGKFTIKIWDTATEKLLHTLPNTDWVVQIRFHPNKKLLASVCGAFTVKIWDTATGKLLHAFPHHNWIDEIRFHPNKKLLASKSFNKIELLEIGRKEPLTILNISDGASAIEFISHENQFAVTKKKSITFYRLTKTILNKEIKKMGFDKQLLTWYTINTTLSKDKKRFKNDKFLEKLYRSIPLSVRESIKKFKEQSTISQKNETLSLKPNKRF